MYIINQLLKLLGCKPQNPYRYGQVDSEDKMEYIGSGERETPEKIGVREGEGGQVPARGSDPHAWSNVNDMLDQAWELVSSADGALSRAEKASTIEEYEGELKYAKACIDALKESIANIEGYAKEQNVLSGAIELEIQRLKIDHDNLLNRYETIRPAGVEREQETAEKQRKEATKEVNDMLKKAWELANDAGSALSSAEDRYANAARLKSSDDSSEISAGYEEERLAQRDMEYAKACIDALGESIGNIERYAIEHGVMTGSIELEIQRLKIDHDNLLNRYDEITPVGQELGETLARTLTPAMVKIIQAGVSRLLSGIAKNKAEEIVGEAKVKPQKEAVELGGMVETARRLIDDANRALGRGDVWSAGDCIRELDPIMIGIKGYTDTHDLERSVERDVQQLWTEYENMMDRYNDMARSL